jgi:hypothetical protein
MGRQRIDLLDKKRFASQDNLQEERYPAGKQCAAHRGPGKKFHHPDVKRGASLGKQAHPEKDDYYEAHHPHDLLEELAGIRKKASELKKKNKK